MLRFKFCVFIRECRRQSPSNTSSDEEDVEPYKGKTTKSNESVPLDCVVVNIEDENKDDEEEETSF